MTDTGSVDTPLEGVRVWVWNGLSVPEHKMSADTALILVFSLLAFFAAGVIVLTFLERDEQDEPSQSAR